MYIYVCIDIYVCMYICLQNEAQDVQDEATDGQDEAQGVYLRIGISRMYEYVYIYVYVCMYLYICMYVYMSIYVYV